MAGDSSRVNDGIGQQSGFLLAIVMPPPFSTAASSASIVLSDAEQSTVTVRLSAMELTTAVGD